MDSIIEGVVKEPSDDTIQDIQSVPVENVAAAEVMLQELAAQRPNDVRIRNAVEAINARVPVQPLEAEAPAPGGGSS